MIADEDEELALKSAQRCAVWLRKKLPGQSVLGPAPGVLVRAGGMFRYQIIIKSASNSRKAVSGAVMELREKYTTQKGVAALMTLDINPYSII